MADGALVVPAMSKEPVMPHGTWKTTDSGGALAALAVGAVAIGAAVGVAKVIPELLPWLLASVAVMTAAVITLAVVALRMRMHAAAHDAERAARQEARAEAALEQARQAALERHERALEIAAASAPKISIDAGLIAGLVNAAQPQPVRVIRGEVER